MSDLSPGDIARFWMKVRESQDGHWLWTDVAAPNGYGYFTYGLASDRQRAGAHRVAYELLVGPIPDGMELDHLCRVRLCVKANHLEAVSTRTNVLRGRGNAAMNAVKTHCIRGHEFTLENTYPNGRDGLRRGCRICRRTRQRQAYWAGK